MKRKASFLWLLIVLAGLLTACGRMASEPEDFALPGDYYDLDSERAMLQVIDNKDGSYLMRVRWGASAMTYTEWTMNATPDGDGKLSYEDGTETEVTVTENGEEEVSVIAVNGVGYFTCRGGKLLWDGAENESCRDCKFIRVEDVALA